MESSSFTPGRALIEMNAPCRFIDGSSMRSEHSPSLLFYFDFRYATARSCSLSIMISR
jgi:hypothetical protein